MIGWFIRILLMLGGVVASWFAGRQTASFPVLEAMFTLLLITVFVAIVAYWPFLVRFFGKQPRE